MTPLRGWGYGLGAPTGRHTGARGNAPGAGFVPACPLHSSRFPAKFTGAYLRRPAPATARRRRNPPRLRSPHSRFPRMLASVLALLLVPGAPEEAVPDAGAAAVAAQIDGLTENHWQGAALQPA